MTRLISATGLVCLALAASLASGCAKEPVGSKDSPGTPASAQSATATDTGQSSSVESSDPVQVTIPAWYFGEATDAEIREAAKGEGYDSTIVNADGSVTYTMMEAKRAEVLKELETDTPDIVAGLTKGKDAVAAFVSVDHNAGFSQFTVKADSSKYSESDGMWANVLLMAGTNLQAFRGVPADSNRVTVQIVDVDSGKTLLSVDSTSVK